MFPKLAESGNTNLTLYGKLSHSLILFNLFVFIIWKSIFVDFFQCIILKCKDKRAIKFGFKLSNLRLINLISLSLYVSLQNENDDCHRLLCLLLQGSSVRHEILLLANSLKQEDSCWELRVRCGKRSLITT